MGNVKGFMGGPWETHWRPMGPRGTHGRPMGYPCMVDPRETHGRLIGDSWWSHGIDTADSRAPPGRPMRDSS